ncbi:DUF2968 domain-containing protein [Paraburkholderia nemoris]|jgi:hypothetical protein|uniref:DUF2968 domain-containing protein n=1 Tax=Paraburkholderia nemoris TaxID=2793076 RepID=A0ABM8RVF5_9BURK|nr:MULTISPECIES: DUF2968 domain-containing protein [Paraburkholderia]KPD19723.1 hypothetical protein ADM96_04750 [Burkholderia sp. ST111]MBK5146455.1 DUF2968 domain-containing protein [Burkholderia sp. R-69608]MBK3737869.1 DUF2968 domain-containing protein [Paraburkholderia aspalathi]MBK3783657.1 DUF2968 domain-containing protein [Paraburkholderia aspalathi]MBK3812033.1 DUF2968 domain-containing protein [Paraburkholderia aspalathi]
MDRKSKLRQIALAAIIAMGAVQGVNAQALPDSGSSAGVVSQPGTTTALPSTQAQTSALTPDEAKQSAAGNVAELQQMIRGSDLSELRTTYNGSYGASLLFYGKEMTYYVALFQQKNFWRVIKTQDATRADMIYKDFVRQTLQLSDVEIRRTQLEAQKAFTERMIALSQDRANRLQADLDVAHQQQTIVANQQQQTRAEATALAQQKASAQDQLRAAQRQVRELQRQLESGLPSH